MKRSLVIVICTLLLFLSSCDSPIKKKPVTEQFSCHFSAVYEQLQLGGTVQREESGTLTVSLVQPPALSGLICQLNGDDMTLKLGDLEYKTEVIPVAAVPRLLREVLDALRYATAEKNEADITTYAGVVGTYAFTALVSAKDGCIQSVSVPDAKLEIQFTEVIKAEN